LPPSFAKRFRCVSNFSIAAHTVTNSARQKNGRDQPRSRERSRRDRAEISPRSRSRRTESEARADDPDRYDRVDLAEEGSRHVRGDRDAEAGADELLAQLDAL